MKLYIRISSFYNYQVLLTLKTGLREKLPINGIRLSHIFEIGSIPKQMLIVKKRKIKES